MEDRKVILKIEHLCKDFDIKAKSFTGKALKLHALSDISLDIYEGETLGIIGESGCGKSTLGRCLVNLHPITSGKLVYDGKELNRLRKKERQALSREIQMVFQDPTSSFNPKMRIRDIVCEPLLNFGRITKKEKDAACRRLLEMVELPGDFVDRYPHNMSGGQRQRIGIARAFLHDAEMILLDEPTSNLDSLNEGIILKSLKESAEKKTVVLVSHRVSTMNVADVVYEMENGRIS